MKIYVLILDLKISRGKIVYVSQYEENPLSLRAEKGVEKVFVEMPDADYFVKPHGGRNYGIVDRLFRSRQFQYVNPQLSLF